MTDTTSPKAPYRGRFAPSPTGDLHLGSLLGALGSWLMARHVGGQWLVRIEDIDPPREVAGAVQRQLATLAAFGLESDEPVARQGERGNLYRAALQKLRDSGQAFECHCSRSDLAGEGGVHRACVADSSHAQPAVRLRVPAGTRVEFEDAIQGRFAQDLATDVGDFVLRRADGLWAYQLAVVADDAAQGITQVVRGADLLDSTPRQVFLQRALGLPTPGYAHLPLLLGPDGRKLSKSLASMPIDPGDPLPALRVAWHALGQEPRALAARVPVHAALSAMRGAFDPSGITAQPRSVMPPATGNQQPVPPSPRMPSRSRDRGHGEPA